VTERFERAERPSGWTGVRDARRPGPACPQPRAAPFTVQSEDCLSVDIWTPDTRGRHPVLVFVHGGGWTHGGTRDPLMDGTRLARALDAVVVTVNMRLGVLGWGHAAHLDGSGDSGNLGLLDLTDALFWINRHIATLGGDPERVTIAGASSGGAAVMALMTFAPAKGAFHRAIAMSGAAAQIRFPRHAAKVTDAVMRAAGADDLAALRALPIERLIAAQTAVTSEAILGDGLFGPVVDRHRITRLPMSRLADGASADVPLMIGTTRHEARALLEQIPLAGWLTPSRLFDALPSLVSGLGVPPAQIESRYSASRPRAGSNDLALAMVTDALFRLPALRVAEARRGASTHVYEFAWFPDGQDVDLRATHGIDVPVLFGTHRAWPTVVSRRPPRALVDAMHRDWTAFVHRGAPADPAWRPYRASERAVRIWDSTPSVAADPHGAERRLWRRLPFDGTGPVLVPAVPRS